MIPDRTKAKAELAAALANYRGKITYCPPQPVAAPGVSPQEERHNARRRRIARRIALEAKRQRLAHKRQRRYR